MKKQRKKPRLTTDNAIQTNTNESVRSMDAFTNAVARLGFGQPNLLESTQYPLTRLTRDFNLMNSLYRSHWVVRRIIDAVPEDMVKNWWKIQSKLPPDELKRLERMERILNLRTRFLEGLRWGRLYGGAIGVIMIAGHEGLLEEPLDFDFILPGSFRGIMILDRWSGVYPDMELVDDISNIEFGLPTYYNIMAENIPDTKVHHSRVVRFTGRDLPHWERQAETYWGASEIEHVFDELKKRDNTSWNIAQLVFLANLRVLKMQDLGQQLSVASTELQNKLYQTLQAQNWLMNNMGLHILDKEDGLETHQYTFSGLSEVYDSFMMDVAGAAEMPVTKLFGRSPAGLNATGESDMQNYYDSIEQKQESQLRPVLEKLLPIMCMSEFGAVPDDLEIKFNPCRRPSEDEKKNLGKNVADSVVAVYNAGIISQKTSLKELRQASDYTGMWSNITDEDIDKASDDAEPAEEASGFGNMFRDNQGENLLDFNQSSVDRASVADGEWNEADHPRGPDGKFGSGGSSEIKNSPEVTRIIGQEYTGVKGQSAVDKLLEEKQGHVKNAFHREDIGDIDLVWGNDDMGIQHVIKRRGETGQDVKAVLNNLTDVIENGKLGSGVKGRFKIEKDGYRAIIEPKLFGEDIAFVFTAMEIT